MFTGKAELFGGEPGLRGVDYIFEANNSVLVAAAATGLKQSPGQMTGGMTIEASVLKCWLVYVSTWFILVYCSIVFVTFYCSSMFTLKDCNRSRNPGQGQLNFGFRDLASSDRSEITFQRRSDV